MGFMGVESKIIIWIEVIAFTKVLALGATGHGNEPFIPLAIPTSAASLSFAVAPRPP
jgi:hypothetical protein